MSHMADSPFRLQMGTYEDSWKIDHATLQDCWVAEDTIRIGIATYDVLRGAERSWRVRVHRGVDQDIREASAFFLSMYAQWRAITSNVLSKAALLERQYQVEGADDLRYAEEKVKATLVAWEVPHPSVSVGMREMILPPEAAAKLDEILSEAKINRPPTPSGSVPRTISMTEFVQIERRG